MHCVGLDQAIEQFLKQLISITAVNGNRAE